MTAKKCTIKDCSRPARARHLCHSHYKRMHAKGRLDEFPLMGPPRMPEWRKSRLTYTVSDAPYFFENGLAPIGTKIVDDDGYMRVKTPYGWKQEHRYVMEQALERSLVHGETIEHANGTPTDNRLENLVLSYRGIPVSEIQEYLKGNISNTNKHGSAQ